MTPEQIKCGFCYDREQGKHGEIKREWSPEWMQFIPVCRKHALCDGMDSGEGLTDGQRRLASKHGTPVQFADAVHKALGEISLDEANMAIADYQSQWNKA